MSSHNFRTVVISILAGAVLMPHSLTAGTPAARLTVCLCNHANVEIETVVRGQKEASRIFREAGIELSWTSCPISERDSERSSELSSTGACCQSAPIVRIVEGGTIQDPRSFLGGIARDNQVTLFYRPIARASDGHDIPRGILMGHVMAHELGHLLLGAKHSSSDIMGARFQRMEVDLMRKGCLLFTARQAQWMRGSVGTLTLGAGLMPAQGR